MKKSLKYFVLFFCLVLTLSFVSSYKQGEVVEKEVYSTWCDNILDDMDDVIDGHYFGYESYVWQHYYPYTRTWGSFPFSLSLGPQGCVQGWGVGIIEKTASQDSHCSIPNYCDESNGESCVRLYYEFINDDEFEPYNVERLYYKKIVETCMRCDQDYIKNEWETGYTGTIRADRLIDRNKCAVKDKCGDPCLGMACPELHCEIADRNRDGDVDDSTDYICVPDETKSLSEAVLKYNIDTSSLSKAGSTTTDDEMRCKCQDTVNYQKCSSSDVSCCKKGTTCCGKENDKNDYFCCQNNAHHQQICEFRGVEGVKGKYACIEKDCPPERPQLCNKLDSDIPVVPRCCKEEDICSFQKMGFSFFGIGYETLIAICSNPNECTKETHKCGDNDASGSSTCLCNKDSDPIICCNTVDQECNELKGVKFCQAKDENSCKEPTPNLCKGDNDEAELQPKICCSSTATCEVSPNGAPYCGY